MNELNNISFPEGFEKFSCTVWMTLVLESLKEHNLENRVLRHKILNHPFKCDHPTCKAVAITMRDVLN